MGPRDKGGMPRRREVDVELDLPRMAGVLGLLIVLVAGAFMLGRLTAPGDGSEDAGAVSRGPAAPVEESELGDEESIFDRAGEGGSPRSTGRQVTSETSRRGAFELDLGHYASRKDADAMRERVRALGMTVSVTGAAGGGYRLVGGPFRSRREAEAAARQAGPVIGRKATVRGQER